MLINFETYLVTEKRFSQHTVEAYLLDVNQFVDFANIEVELDFKEVNHQLIRLWVVFLVENEYQNKSINRKIASLRTFFKFLLKTGKVEKNPALKIVGPKLQKKLPSFVKESEINTEKLQGIFTQDFVGVRDQLMFELFYQTGIRLSELVELKENNVSKDAIKVLGKRNKERIVPISNSLGELIVRYKALKTNEIKDYTSFICLNNGNKVYPKFVYRKINYYLSLITNLDVKSPHVLRHTFATHMLNNGAGLESIKEILGHSSLSATQVYTHNSFAKLTNIYSSAHPRGRKKN